MLNQAVALLPKPPACNASASGSSGAWTISAGIITLLKHSRWFAMIKMQISHRAFARSANFTVSFSFSAESGGEFRVERAELVPQSGFFSVV